MTEGGGLRPSPFFASPISPGLFARCGARRAKAPFRGLPAYGLVGVLLRLAASVDASVLRSNSVRSYWPILSLYHTGMTVVKLGRLDTVTGVCYTGFSGRKGHVDN